MVFVDMASLIPENHLLRKIDGMVSFDFIYGLLAPYYSATGRPSVDPVSMFKMLLVGYLYGIKSERRLVEEIRLNIAYRWFCGFELDDAIPDHSTFSKTRTRKWQQSGLFQNAFYEIVKQCIACGLIDGKAMAADGSYIPANVSRESWVDVETEVEQSMQSYLDALDEELSQQPGFKKPPERTIKKRRTTSRTDPDSGYINHGNKRGIGYLMEATVDCKHGILTGVDVYPANEKESLLVLRHLEQQIKLGVPMNQLALDRGYDTGAVHRGLELLGVTGYIPAIQFPNAPEKYGFSYNPQRDAFICPEGVGLTYHRLNCNQSTGKYLRCYQIEDDACKHCVKRPSCFDKAGIRRRVLASSCYPAFFRGHQRVGTPEFLSMMRLRKIWAEGSFSVLKREHCISKIRKRGILAATEECLLAAMALNLKRMASAVFFYLHISYSAGTTAGFGSFLAFVNGSNTWDDLMDVCETLKENGIAPVTLDGTTDLYNEWWFIRFAERLTTMEKIHAAAKGDAAFADEPAFLKAAQYVATFSENGYFQDGAAGSVFPAAQALFTQGKAGLLFCGAWIPTEMASQTPPEMEMKMFALPELPDSVSPWHEEIWSNAAGITVDGKNKENAINFLKIFSSMGVQEGLTALKNPSPLVGGPATQELDQIENIVNNATSISGNYGDLQQYGDWFVNVLGPLSTQLINGAITPEAFITQLDTDTAAFYQ